MGRKLDKFSYKNEKCHFHSYQYTNEIFLKTDPLKNITNLFYNKSKSKKLKDYDRQGKMNSFLYLLFLYGR